VFFALLPALAWAQQVPPPPDTQAARERHRKAEHEPPPPEGPWGPEEFGLTWNTPVWRGAFADVEYRSGSGIHLSTPRGAAGFSDGVSRTFVEKLDWHSEDFRTVGGLLTADLDILRISAEYFSGSFVSTATLAVDDGPNPERNISALLHGTAYGAQFGVYWPAIRYRDSLLEVSLGPIATVGWLHEEVRSVPEAPFPMRDSKDILTGSLGPELSLRAYFGSFSIEVAGEYSFMTGAARGWTRSALLGIGYKF
jgi:hypothetical protein